MRWTIVIFLSLFVVNMLAAQPGDSLRGQAVLRDEGCLSCHSVLGAGGSGAPDLGRPTEGVFSPAALAASVWNHIPEMWTAMARRGQSEPQVSDQQMRDLFAYLYSVRYFEPSGDAGRGAAVYRDMQCYRCHALVDTGTTGIGPSVAQWQASSDMILFLENMWNHGETMNRERQIDQLAWPTFTTTQMADMLAYIYNLPSLPPTPARLQLGDSTAGMKVFDDLGCAKCHSVVEGDPDSLSFTQSEREHRTITGLAVAMWNHRPIMEEWSTGTGLPLRNFEPGQMAQLLSYLFEEGFLEERGNAERGEVFYTDKGCAQCHETGVADPLPRKSFTVTDVTAGIWRHGPEVRQAMRDQRMTWPHLAASDIADLVAWLNAR
jgi:cytochrome c2